MIRSRWAAVAIMTLTMIIGSSAGLIEADERSCRSGIYPHLAMYNNEGECGTGAVVPWADRLWVVTYGPHCVKGSSDRLYEITPDLRQVVRPESVGGTHANRMIHAESQQLFIGYHAIDVRGNVRTIPPKAMPGRLTGAARHLTDPANKIYLATMEEGLYEIDVKSLAVRELLRDGNIRSAKGLDLPERGTYSKLPGYHGKGLYTGQGRLIYANNGERDPRIKVDPTIPSGALAEWTGSGDFRMVRRNQFTEVRGPGDLRGNPNPETDPVWALGWDYRSVILMLLDGGTWHAYRLPKGSHSYDGSHGWNTEWPRIRDIGGEMMLATMHGTFWRFPRMFARTHSAGISPRSNYLKVVGDFCRWKDRVVLGCDDSAQKEFLNRRPFKSEHGAPGQSHSNLWFIRPDLLDALGPPIGRGSVWLRDDVPADTPSDPYLFAGYDHRMVHVVHETPEAVTFTLEVDRKGDGSWETLRTIDVPAKGSAFHIFADDETGAWIRARAGKAAKGVCVHFQYRCEDTRTMKMDPAFAGVATVGTQKAMGGIVRALGGNRRVMGVVAVDLESGEERGYYEMDESLRLVRKDDAGGRSDVMAAVSPAAVYRVDAASVVLIEDGKRFRIPRNDAYVAPDTAPAKADNAGERPNLAVGAGVSVSSTHESYAGSLAVDGKVTEASRWVSKPEGEKWIALDLGDEKTIAGARITSGYGKKPGTAVKDAKFQMKRGEAWSDIPGGSLRGNSRLACTINFREPVRTRHIRLVSNDTTYVRIYELALFAKPMKDEAPAAGGLNVARVCREVATERDLFNCHGTFYELPARNAGGFPKIRPVASHTLAVHDYASYRGMLVLTGIDPEGLEGRRDRIAVSEDGRCAVWCGVIDDLWRLGKPRGEGGPWKESTVKAGVPSDPYLMTGYDRKTLSLSHAGSEPVTFTVEVDPDGTGLWCVYKAFEVAPEKVTTHVFPEGFGAYWIRVRSDKAVKATAWLKYE